MAYQLLVSHVKTFLKREIGEFRTDLGRSKPSTIAIFKSNHGLCSAGWELLSYDALQRAKFDSRNGNRRGPWRGYSLKLYFSSLLSKFKDILSGKDNLLTKSTVLGHVLGLTRNKTLAFIFKTSLLM